MFDVNGAGAARLPAWIAVLFLLALGVSTPAHAANRPPSISGTPVSWVYVGSPYSFSPAASDADGQSLRFTVFNKPSWATFSASTGRLAGTPTAVGLWTNIRIEVSDGIATRALASFSIRARRRDNTAPTISGSPASSVAAGSTYAFQPAASDADGDPVRFRIANRPVWASFDSSTGRLRGTPTAANAGTYSSIVITATRRREAGVVARILHRVSSTTNRAPTISGAPPASVTVGRTYSFRPVAADADNNTLGFSIQNRPVWATFSSATGQLSGTPTTSHARTYSNVVISVSDGKASAALAPFAITVATVPNKAPTISGTPSVSVNAGSAYAFRPSAADADGDTLTFSIANRPAWATFNAATGRLSGTPTASSVGTYSNIVIA